MWLLIAAVAIFAWGVWLGKSKQNLSKDSSRTQRQTGEVRRVNGTLRLKYQDAQGQTTQRTVTVRSYDTGVPTGLSGFCHLRREMRTFRVDRVVEAIDNETGEIIANLVTWLQSKVVVAPHVLAQRLLTMHPHALPIFVYMAKADGAMRQAEKDIILEHVLKMGAQVGVTTENAADVLGHITPPDFTQFCHHAHEVLRLQGASGLQSVLDTARHIVHTQKTVHIQEQQALDYLNSLLPTT